MTNSEVFARAKTLACDYSNKHIAIGLSKYADVLLPRAPLFFAGRFLHRLVLQDASELEDHALNR